MPQQPDERLYRKVLELRFKEELGIERIAEEIGVKSRYVTPKLREATLWLLKQHQQLTRRPGPISEKSPIERRLLNKYQHLLDVFVIPGTEITEAYEYDRLIARWARMAADYLDRLVDDAAIRGRHLRVALSGGETILEVVSSLPIADRGNAFFFASALIGRANLPRTSHVDAIANATVAWSRSGRVEGRCIYATVSPYDFSGTGPTYKERRQRVVQSVQSLAEEPLIGRFLEFSLINMDVALAGIGTVSEPDDPLLRGTLFTATNLLKHTARIERSDLEKDHAIGDIGYCYFDENGEGSDKWRFYLTAGDHDEKLRGVNFYKDMVRRKKPVIVLAGAFKEKAIIAALRGELFNVWFTNEDAARKALRDTPQSS